MGMYLRYFKLRTWRFFTLGSYAMGMYLMRQIGDRGVYGNPELPDLMVFLNVTELPWFWAGSVSIAWMVCMMFLGPSLLAFIFGSLAFRSRVSLAIKPGSRTCIMGRNGVDKTTWLKAIMGLLPMSSGKLTFGE
jgi:hypothetical protein